MNAPRADVWQTGNVNRRLPIYFPSISSVKTNLAPVDYARVLNRVSAGRQYLVSAYDVIRGGQESQDALVNELHTSKNSDTLVLMDSGNYESFWMAPPSPWTPEEFHEALHVVKPIMAFGFDNQEPPTEIAEYLRQLNTQQEADRIVVEETTIVPIVHGPPAMLTQLCPVLARDQHISAIAVPERVLGSGILERTKAVRSIREALDRIDRYVVLHLLGTGNPISLALYANAGADSFDGLEWCQTVVDHETALLHHFSQGDFFRFQTRWGSIDIAYLPRVLAHNLEFYGDWMARLGDAISENAGNAFFRHNFPERIYVQCAAAFGWEAN